MKINPLTFNNNKIFSFKKNEKNNEETKQCCSQKSCAFNPKAATLALALACMTPSCSEGNKKHIQKEDERFETYQSLNKLKNDFNIHEGLIWQLHAAMNIDSVKIEKIRDKGFKLTGIYEDKNIELTMLSSKKDPKKVYGVLKTDNIFNKSDIPMFIPYTADFNDNLKDIEITYKIVKDAPKSKCKVHRNDNGKLFLISENGDITPIKNK